MIKIEQLRNTDQFKRVLPIATAVTLPPPPPMFQTTSIVVPKRSVDPRAIDISSIKGRFAWERIPLSDTYMPVIFRGTTKYFCTKMLRKVLPEYPDDVIRRPSYFHYQKSIDLYIATPNEVELLNRINAHHSHWTYARQPFTIQDELVRVMDFLPFYDHLRLYCKPGAIPRTASVSTSRTILPPSQQNMQRPTDFLINKPTVVGTQTATPVATTPVQIQPYPASELSRGTNSSAVRPIAPVQSAIRPSRQPKHGAHQVGPPPQPYSSIQQRQQVNLPATQQPIPMLPSDIVNSTNTVLPNTHSTVPLTTTVTIPSTSQPSTPTTTVMAITSSSPDAIISSPTATSSRKLSITSLQKQPAPISKQPSSSSISASTLSDLHCGWLQINKLYTPYISTTVSNRHLYKIPVSLLTFYELLKIPSTETNANESKDTSSSSSSSAFEQILVTPQEIELINELCLKQNIKPFSIDTKLISLTTFYQYCSATILFIKELPMTEPKASICKDWSSIVQINGGICRLRNISTLHEQTVPFIGNNLLKIFIISSQCLASASLTSPSIAELEFLQLILFFSNMSINLRNAKLIDIESVQKEYNVDLILLFNDKFPLNVLNYQQQGNRPSTSQGQIIQSNSSAAANTFAESTPPPSPPSPPNNQPKTTANPSSQLPLTSSASSSNRYQKTITFHGHPMTAYICSGLGSNAQRECISVKALCKILYPNSTILDKLESKMLRFLRLKNINRFRPQNQQSMGFTRLIDVKDAENHWDYIEEEMRSVSNNDEETNVVSVVTSSLSDKDSQASTLNKVGTKDKTVEEQPPPSISETSIEVIKGSKRLLSESGNIRLEEEDVPVLERIDKRIRISEQDGREQATPIRFHSTKTTKDEYDHLDSDDSVEDDDDDDDDKMRRERDNNKSKNQRGTTKQLPVTTFRRHVDQKMVDDQRNEKTSSSFLASSQKRALSTKKKIKLIRKRTTPRTRSNKQSKASWVEKYNIEECCIRLDLCDNNYKTGKN